MKINGMQRMLGAFLAAAIITGLTIVVPPATAQNSPHHYSDDAIVRDLKAGKLTVREAQMLRERRDHVAAPVAPVPVPHPVKAPPHLMPHQHHKAGKEVKHGKQVHAGKAAPAKKPGKAPVHHLTAAHPKHNGKLKAHAKTLHGEQDKTVHGKHGKKPVKAIKPVKAHKAKAGADDSAPVRHQAVKYIR